VIALPTLALVVYCCIAVMRLCYQSNSVCSGRVIDNLSSFANVPKIQA